MTKTNLKAFAGAVDPIPIIDLFFLLLIFSLIGSSLVFQPGIQVQLPRAPATEMHGLPKIVVTISRPTSETQAGREMVFFNDSLVTWDSLEKRLRQEVRDKRLAMGRTATEEEKRSGHRKEPLLVLRADAGVAYEKIIRVMSLARSLDLGVYLVTDPDKAPARTRDLLP